MIERLKDIGTYLVMIPVSLMMVASTLLIGILFATAMAVTVISIGNLLHG